MSKSYFTCPHCNRQSEVTLIAHKSPKFPKNGTFENTAAMLPPKNPLKQLFWFLRGNTPYLPQKPRPTDMTLQIETWNHAAQTVTFKHLDPRITVGIVQDIARMVDIGHDWTRDNLVKFTSLSENKTRVVQAEFKRLGYLEVLPNNRSVVTSQGRLFLRGVLRV